MIAYLEGAVIEVDEEKCTLDVQGVGYSVFSSRKTLKELGAMIAAAGASATGHAGKGQADGGPAVRGPAYRNPTDCGPRVKLFTRLIHREDSMELYGFLSRQEHTFFNLLITVSGIGPKNALKILGACEVADIAGAIVSENSSFLKSIAGIGEKKAQQIILELKAKIKKLFHFTAESLKSSYLDAIELLEQLGFSKNESRDAVDKALSVIEGDGNVEKIVEIALQSLSGQK